MSLLIINTVSENDYQTQDAIKKLTENISDYKLINTSELNISHCTGCCACMLETPGACCLKDDYEEIFKSFFKYNDIVFVSDIVLNFINHKTVNIIQRMFPLVTVLSVFKDGKILHVPRYDKVFRLGLLYKGKPDEKILNAWFNKYAEHFSSISLGVFPISKVKEMHECIL